MIERKGLAVALAGIGLAGAIGWGASLGSATARASDPLREAAAASGVAGRRLDLRAGQILVPTASGALAAVPRPAGDDRAFLPRASAVGDFDGDGGEALAVADYSGDRVVVYRPQADGDGAFDVIVSIDVPAGPRGLLAADLDEDGRSDLAVLAVLDPSITVLLSRGDGVFEAAAALALPGPATALDRDAEGAFRATLAEGGAVRFRSLGGGFFESWPESVAAAPAPELSAFFAGPAIDFDGLRACASGLAMPAKKIGSAVAKVNKAETIFGVASAGTKLKKFGKAVKQLVGYQKVIQGQVGSSIDQTQADACLDPARAAVDQILLIGVAAGVEVVSGDGQTARPFAALGSPLAARVTDAFGNPIVRAQVAFAVAGGTAEVSPAGAASDEAGDVEARLTMGAPPDEEVTVSASIPGLAQAVFVAHKQTGTISLAADIQPIFNRSCALSGCHAAAFPQEGMSLAAGALFDAGQGIVGVVSAQAPPRLRVAAGAASQSYLVDKIEGTQEAAGGSGASMPDGAPLLPPVERFLIGAWVDQGAADN